MIPVHRSSLALSLSLSVASLLAVACAGSGEKPLSPTPGVPATSASAAVTAPPAASSAAPMASSAAPETPPPPKEPEPTKAAVTWQGGFATPESVLYDEAKDRYLVSNIQGRPVDGDNNGFISELTPDGKISNLKWIEGGKNGVSLDAPKGMVIVKGVLYVTDRVTVRMFDAKTGKPKGEIKLDGATFANDIAAGPDGKIYVSDSGLKMTDKGAFEGTGTDAVWVIEKGKARPLAKADTLGRPNGLLVKDSKVHVVTFGSGERYALGPKGEKEGAEKLPAGSLDGIVDLGDSLLVSSWESSTVYQGKAGSWTAVVVGVKAPADIGYDTKRKRVLVPRFLDDKVEAFDVK